MADPLDRAFDKLSDALDYLGDSMSRMFEGGRTWRVSYRSSNEKIIGTCGKCGGPVVMPIASLSVTTPIPCCASCGAHPKQDYGPTMDMA